MNTIRRKLTCTYPCHSDSKMNQEDILTFEGEKGKFIMILENHNPFNGCQRTRISLDKAQAEVLFKSLGTFLK